VEVAQGVHLVPGMSGNVCLVTDPEVVLFDAGLPGDGPAILAHLGRVGLAARALTAIALTHADAGHAGSAPWLRRNSPARILASAEAAAAAAGRRAVSFLHSAERVALSLTGRRLEDFAVDGVLAPGDELAGFTVVATPGHTAGHLSFFRPQDGLLLAGDAVRISGRDILAPAFWDTQSEIAARISVARLADLPVHLLIAGHGPPYREPGAELRRCGGPSGFLEEQLRRREAHRREGRRRRRAPK